LKTLQKKLDQEIERHRKIENTFHEKLKKYERTAADANRDALKNFV
jgi:predicted transposase YbfD/YdcC